MSRKWLQNYLLYLFVLTAVFAQYPAVYMVNNIIMILFIGSSFLTKPSHCKSRIFYYYSIIVIISTFNQVLYYLTNEFYFTPNYLTLPVTLMLLYAVNRIKIYYSFEDLVIVNIYFLPILFIAGGFGTYQGRIHTEFLSPNLQGMIVFFGFIVSAQNVLRRKHILLSAILFGFTALFMIISGSRQNMLFMVLGLLFLFYPIMTNRKYFKKNGFTKRIIVGTCLITGGAYFLSNSINNLGERFGGISSMASQISIHSSEYSAAERLSFMQTAIDVSTSYLTGVGHGNTKQAIETYGNNRFKVTNNSHSLFAELLFSAGFGGIVVWLFIFIRLTKICLNKAVRHKYGFIPFYYFIATWISPLLFLKVLWVLIVVLEKNTTRMQGDK